MLKTNSFQFCPHFQLCTMESSKPFFHIVCEISPEGVFLALVRKELPVLLKIDNYVHFWPLTLASQQALRVLKVQLWTENCFQRTFFKPIWNSCTGTAISSFGGKKRERFLFYLYVGQIYLSCSRNFSWFWCRQVFQSENRWVQHKESPALHSATITKRPFHSASDMCFLPLCHHDSAWWHAERSLRWKQCRAVLGWCDLPWLFCVYLIYCTSYFLFPHLSAARHVVLTSASAWSCICRREQGCPEV